MSAPLANILAGPWEFHAQGDADEYCLITTSGGWVIALRINGELLTPEQEAIGRLIASAPAMLEALILALPYIESAEEDEAYKPGAVAKITAKVRAAIAGAVQP